MANRLLSEAEGYGLLERLWIPVPDHSVAKTADEAVRIAEKIGYPVVAKIVSPQVIHKSDAGGVAVGLKSSQDVSRAFAEIIRNVRKKAPEAEIKGLIIEKQMPPGLELIVGGKTDPSFGKVLTFGLGGKLVELMKDVSIRVLPVDKDDIVGMIHEIRGYGLIAGYRGETAKDEKALVETVNRLSELFFKNDKLIEFDINPLILYEKGICAVDARIYEAETRVETKRKPEKKVPARIFYPRSIAVVGASSNPEKVGYAVFRNLLSFEGSVCAVNPKREEILGHTTYPNLSSVPGSVDMIVVTVPAAIVPEIMEDAGRKGVKLAVVITAGFKELGEEGNDLERKVLEIAQRHGIRIVGPNCIGVILPHQSINATFDPATPKPGRLAFISQSGAIITTVVDWSLKEDVDMGLSAVISVGNQADLGFDEFLKFAGGDKDTSTVVLYIEEIKDGRAFMRVVRDVAKNKPVVAIKSGASARGQKAASSHTGALAGSYEVYEAAFRQAGVIPAHSLREAFQVGELLASEGYPKGKRTIVITNAGGFAVLATDYAERYGLDIVDLPKSLIDELSSFLTDEWSHENPMDIIGDAGADRYAKVFDTMTRNQDEWDIAFIIAVPSGVLDARDLATEIARFSARTHKMIVGCMLGGSTMRSGVHILRKASIPNFDELEEAFDAVGKALKAAH